MIQRMVGYDAVTVFFSIAGVIVTSLSFVEARYNSPTFHGKKRQSGRLLKVKDCLAPSFVVVVDSVVHKGPGLVLSLVFDAVADDCIIDVV